MPPDDTGEWDDADLPGLDDSAPDDADLPGLDDSPPSKPDVPTDTEPSGPEEPSIRWTNKELDDWFESDFGGSEVFKKIKETFEGASEDRTHPEGWVPPAKTEQARRFDEIGREELAQDAYRDRRNAWDRLSHEAKTQLRRDWEDPQQATASATAPDDEGSSLLDDLPPIVVDPGSGRFSRQPIRHDDPLPRWIFIGGGVGILGLVLAVGIFVFGGPESSDTESAPLTREATAQDLDEPASDAAVAETAPRETAEDTAAAAPEPMEVTIGPSRFVVTVPQMASGQMPFTVCSYDTTGAPRVGAMGFLSIGRDPAGPEASHASGVFGANGCFSGEVEVKESPGMTNVLTSDGSESVVVGEVLIVAAVGG